MCDVESDWSEYLYKLALGENTPGSRASANDDVYLNRSRASSKISKSASRNGSSPKQRSSLHSNLEKRAPG